MRGWMPSLLWSELSGLTLVTQTPHKEKMKNKKRISMAFLQVIARFRPIGNLFRPVLALRLYPASHKDQMKKLIKFHYDLCL